MKKKHLKGRRKDNSYRNFVIPCVIYLIGHFYSQYNGILYSDFSFLYVILGIVCCTIVGMKCLIKSRIKSYVIGWWSFCISIASFFIINVLYTKEQENNSFVSQIENVSSGGYRFSPYIMFEIDGQIVSLSIVNEIPIKEKSQKGPVYTYGDYKRGLSSSVMIVDYDIIGLSGGGKTQKSSGE